ncbi:MAG: hypothetical protein A2287_00055 [Candidatus Melainabacteria bacterium RIFOXYA12_FULL_32_12]|nr:MAG: hypothetical protein A2255_10805 [Candidatus Melainabacteria bacterium RIFOXYA2_FULL_32_9]OGI31806.1 MAG: hypothetical protein A2287_00055 [Candidatus Melainabacteria bacterium RIFOXYA12_FULL_32_12]
MKALFYSIYNTCIPVLGTELEIMSNHLEKRDEVYVLRCHGELEYCDVNPDHNENICYRCNKSFYENIKKINLPKKNVLKIPRCEINYNELPAVFKNLQELKEFNLNGIKYGLAIASTLISEYKDHELNTILHRRKIHRLLRTSYFTYNFIRNVLKKIKPDCLYHQGGRSSNIFPVFKVCQELGIDSYSINNAGTLDKYALYKNNILHNANILSQEMKDLWDKSSENKEEIGAKWFIDKRNGVDNYQLSYTKNQKRDSLPVNFDVSKKNIAIFNSSIYEYAAIEGWENPIYEDELDGLKKIFESFKNDTDIKFYLRIHPNLKDQNNSQMQELKKISSINYPNLEIIWPEELIDSYALVNACDKTLVFLSTIGIEACFWEKPSILAGNSPYSGLDCCYKPKTHEELIELLKYNLVPKDKQEALKYGYWNLTRGIFYKRYEPKNIYEGTFLGQDLKIKISAIDNLICKLSVKIKKFLNINKIK